MTEAESNACVASVRFGNHYTMARIAGEAFMAMILNEEQTMLKDSAKDFCATNAPITQLRQLRDEENALNSSALKHVRSESNPYRLMRFSDTADFEIKRTDYYDRCDEGSLLWNDEDSIISWPIGDLTESKKGAMASLFAALDK